MVKIVRYENSEEREIKLKENEEMYLWEERNVVEGNFLIFVDRPRIDVEPVPYDEEVQIA